MYQPKNTEREYPSLHLNDKRVRIQRTEKGSRIYATDQNGNETTLTLGEQCEATIYMTSLFHTELCEIPVEKHPYLFMRLATGLHQFLLNELIRIKVVQSDIKKTIQGVEQVHITPKPFEEMTLDEFNEFFRQKD